jgi:3-dehydroquinate synthase
MVDSSLGGKTAVNLPGGKNLVGSFHQPWGVYADPSVLATLPDREYREGFAEVVKTAAIADGPFFGRLERASGRLLEREPGPLDAVVARCLRIKAAVVRRDEREAGRRAVLNFGHTVGHALEAAEDYTLRHGPAVSIGLVVESRLARDLTAFPERHVLRLEQLLEDLRLPTRVSAAASPAAVVAAARRDKKNRDGEIRCSLPLRLGRMPPGHDVTLVVEEKRLAETVRACRDVGPD